ncbi:MAG: HIT family protein [Candidatus Woesearchaeota archaeon]
MNECIFCKIVRGEIPAYKIWEDEKFYAFLDINPITQGHTLLIPKKHHDYIFDYEMNDYSEIFVRARMLAQTMKKATGAKRIGVTIEGFAVPHIHIHLVPINKGNELDPCNAKPATAQELHAMQKKLETL